MPQLTFNLGLTLINRLSNNPALEAILNESEYVKRILHSNFSADMIMKYELQGLKCECNVM